jgi:hypothetical protein
MKLLSLYLLLAINVITQPATGQAPVLKFSDGRVWVTGLGSTSIADDQWKDMLRVYTHEAFTKRMNQPIGGTYVRHGDSLSFKPNFSFVAGGSYRAIFGKLELSFSIPEEKFTQTIIEAVHPQAEVLPENMLRMYISFSAPMMPGEAYNHITLLTENGTPVEKAFLIIDQELWDTDRKRFTLLFDPGRVKRGIQSNVKLGAPLTAGQKYKLVIDSTWRDAHGNSLAHRHTKTFTVTQAERTKLSINNWKIITPTAGSREDLLIYMDRPIDYVLASKCITITNTQAGKVSGVATLTGSSLWRFTPDQPWAEDQYNIEVYPHLEDVAGNNFNNAFDIDLSKESRRNTTEVIRHSFSIRPIVK